MSEAKTYPRCAHCGGNGSHWVPWRGMCHAVKDLRREQAGDDLLCRFCRARFDAGDWVEPGSACLHPEALRRAREQRREEHGEEHRSTDGPAVPTSPAPTPLHAR